VKCRRSKFALKVDASRNEVRVLSHPQGQRAEIVGLNRAQFLDALCRAKVPACKVIIDELMEEFDRVVKANRQRVSVDPSEQDRPT
jgi:hypothetical protein